MRRPPRQPPPPRLPPTGRWSTLLSQSRRNHPVAALARTPSPRLCESRWRAWLLRPSRSTVRPWVAGTGSKRSLQPGEGEAHPSPLLVLRQTARPGAKTGGRPGRLHLRPVHRPLQRDHSGGCDRPPGRGSQPNGVSCGPLACPGPRWPGSPSPRLASDETRAPPSEALTSPLISSVPEAAGRGRASLCTTAGRWGLVHRQRHGPGESRRPGRAPQSAA